MDWGQIGTTPDFPTWGAKFHYYRTHHPIVVGCSFMLLMGGCVFGYLYATKLNINSPIKKYKDAYYVYRPDDPHVKILKTGPLGIDYEFKWDK